YDGERNGPDIVWLGAIETLVKQRFHNIGQRRLGDCGHRYQHQRCDQGLPVVADSSVNTSKYGFAATAFERVIQSGYLILSFSYCSSRGFYRFRPPLRVCLAGSWGEVCRGNIKTTLKSGA